MNNMTEINNKLYIDDREKRDVQVLADIICDNVEITRLDIGDFLMRGIIFEHKRPDDFVSSIFNKRLFIQIANMTEHYKYAFILVSGEYRTTELLYNTRSKRPNFVGVIGSCVARGCVPIFANSIETCIKLVDVISAKLTDGKVRDRPIKTTSLKDQQLSIICSLPGVSDTRAKALLAHFGSINGILTASEKELTEVKDVGVKTARKIKRILKKNYIG